VARTPDAVGVRLNLVADLLQRERGIEALALLEAAPLPGELSALRQRHLARILVLLQLGCAAAARAALDDRKAVGPVPPKLAPLLYWRQALLAQLERDEGRSSAARSDRQRRSAAWCSSSV
jgi:hypothetical protein